jgi:hypothetical protein
VVSSRASFVLRPRRGGGDYHYRCSRGSAGGICSFARRDASYNISAGGPDRNQSVIGMAGAIPRAWSRTEPVRRTSYIAEHAENERCFEDIATVAGKSLCAVPSALRRILR